MHLTSFEKMRSIRDAYIPGGSKVLDVGAASFDSPTYRDLFGVGYEYVGLDIDHGNNVDLVVADPYDWQEIETDSFDSAISGQAFEHNPYFWITTVEMARVVRPGGVVAVIAPARGHVHRYPFDCWRFYPDSWAVLANYVGLKLEETYLEPANSPVAIDGVVWGDSLMVARKPLLTDPAERQRFDERLALIRSTATPAFPDEVVLTVGPAMADYERRSRVTGVEWRKVQVTNLIRTALWTWKKRLQKSDGGDGERVERPRPS